MIPTRPARRKARRGFLIAAASACLMACFSVVRAGEPAGAPSQEAPAVSLTVEDAAALMGIIRARILPGVPAPATLPDRLQQPLHLPLIVTLYGGPSPVQRTSARTTLNESAREAADELARGLSLLPNGERLITDGRLEVDVVVRHQLLSDRERVAFIRSVEPGLTGFAFPSGNRKTYFTPLMLFVQWRHYLTHGAVAPPNAERVFTASFVEERPGGKALPLYRGNVLLPPPDAERIVEAMSYAGLWLLHTQQPDGAFLPPYFPAEGEAEKSYSLSDHLRGMGVLAPLRQLTEDRRFSEGYARGMAYALDPRFVREERREGIFYLPLENDDVTASAQLLVALCNRVLAEPNPTSDGRMKSLGEFLAQMTAPDGRLYVQFANAQRKAPPFIVRGETYGEALMALALLERISAAEKRRKAAGRMADLIISAPGTVQIQDDVRAMARVAEALAEYYKLTRTEKYAETSLKIVQEIMARQIKAEGSSPPDCVGGFVETGILPDTETTGAALCAMAAAYETSLLLRRPAGAYSAPARNAALFLMNMQHRPENAFFLPRQELILGSFRQSPQDLSVRVGATAVAIRALIGAAPLAAETVRPDAAPGKP